MKRILLTGSGGFLGSNLKPYLLQGYQVFAPRSKELNLLDFESVQKYISANKIDFIIHSAAAGVRITPDATAEDVARPNILMFDNLVHSGTPIMTFGSGAEYDKSRPLVKVKESVFGQSVPEDPYGFSKYQISKKIETLPNALNLRIFGIYGPGENPSRVTTHILNSVLNRRDIILNQNVLFSFIFIEDFCKIAAAFVQNPPKAKFINVACPWPEETGALAETAKKLFKSDLKILFKTPGFNKEYTCDTSLLNAILPDFKFTSYETGLEKLCRHLKGEINA
ncbi:NAD-dependent epimerase/dehydratase family protein [Candidatus Proelusimicrobium excrementi]|uniref:NAD-dependent epimerase/dehydratase family protein n=1 Tax=Candidatus Proelusimicrobium excrementi TaxID=3416222 RepID=UPI003C98FE33|nr:NAD(P)-dependent oxidoreductase [Elusimicrobiaceae bacterium]